MSRAPVRPYLQVVLQRHRLPVEHEVPVLGVRVQQVQQRVHHPHQPRAELLERLVPLAVPVRVRDDDECAVHAANQIGFPIAQTTSPRSGRPRWPRSSART